MKWVLLPGLGCDRRLFDNIVDLLPDLQIVEFEIPQPTETIEHYASRLAEKSCVNRMAHLFSAVCHSEECWHRSYPKH